MNIKTIIALTDSHDVQTLTKAEAALLEGETLPIEVAGIDEGEQLTHLMAAIWCKNEMESTGCDSRTAVRQYTQKVRNSIS